MPNRIRQWELAATTNGTTWNRDTLECLERMLPVAIDFVQERFGIRLKEAGEALNEAGIEDKTYQKFLFDPVEVFESDAIVKRILEARGKASDRFRVEE